MEENSKRKPKDTYQIFIGGLPPETKTEDVLNYFSGFGEITEIRMMYDKITSKKNINFFNFFV